MKPLAGRNRNRKSRRFRSSVSFAHECLSMMQENFEDPVVSKRPKNKNYASDIERTLKYTRWFLNFLGVWPMLTICSSVRSKYLGKFVIFICHASIVFTMLPASLHTLFREKNPLTRLMLMGPVSSSFASLAKYSLIVLRTNTIKICVERVKKDWMRIESEEERAIMIRNSMIGRGITIICSLFLYTGGMFYHTIMPVFKGSKIDEFNVTIRPLVYPGFDIFIDPQTTPIYEIIFFLTCVSAFVRYTVTIAICNLAALFVCHACGQIEIVMSRLNRIFHGIVDEKHSLKTIRKRISLAVECHVKGFGFSSGIDEALREIFLIEVVAATLIICLLEYYCMTEWSNSEIVAIITYFILLTSYVFNIFILCYIGELLKEQCEKVGKAAYMIEWYRLPGKNGLAILLIMAMSNYPRKITAGWMMELSLCSFGIIIKTSVMWLNMLRAIAD